MRNEVTGKGEKEEEGKRQREENEELKLRKEDLMEKEER